MVPPLLQLLAAHQKAFVTGQPWERKRCVPDARYASGTVLQTLGWWVVLSAITSLVSGLKKNRTIVGEATSLAVKENASIATEIDTLSEQATRLQETAAEKQATREALDHEIADLEGQLAAEQREKSHMESSLAAQKVEATKIKVQHQKLEKTFHDAEADFELTKERLAKVEGEIRSAEGTVKQQETQLRGLAEEQEKALAKLTAETGTAGDQSRSLQAKYQALRYLVKEQIVTSPAVLVTLQLKGKETTTLGHLQNATFLNRLSVVEVLEKLAKRGVLRFDSNTGEVTLLRPIDL
jgi:predicted  nucleic acid-binding Zn-ribbon protein